MHKHSDYVPLHLHTEYSLLDGAIRIDELMEAASAMRMPAVTVTDHGNLFGAVEFYKKAVKAGIKPIIGCEVYVAPESRFDRSRSETDESSFHLILLAKDNAGYRNLLTLVSKAYIEGFYYKPRIDRSLLEQYSGGLIALTSCMKGEVPYYLKRDMTERARETALAYKHILGPENFFIELQENGLAEQEALNKKLIALSEELHIGLVATNDCHYLLREDARAHDILLCIQTGKTFNNPKRLRFESNGFYFKSPDEMKAAFRDVPEAVLNTMAIAERCNVELALGASLLPKFTPPGGMKASAYLQSLAEEGLRERLGGSPPEAYAKRLSFELSVIKKMGYASYFLIVWDFVNYSKRHGIPVGPGRGSAAGSLVSYATGITEIDPLRYNLLFERFLNPDRVSMPDIDMDFCKDRRGEVISYVSEKYGKDHVAQIITFGTMAAKAAIRDVARALDYPYAEADKLAKLVPETLKMTIDNALKSEPRLKELYDNDPKVKEILDIAKRLEGIARHASTHAAGVVISPVPLTDIAPLYKNPGDETVTTQFDMSAVESVGLVKFDLLGLKTLTIIDKTLRHIKETGEEFRLKDIPLDDRETYALLSSGQTTGIFQFESAGMRDLLIKLEPNRFEELLALVALYRPGPIRSGMIEDFIKGKKGLIPVEYKIPGLKGILAETYGVIVYQEQVMRIANEIASFTLGQADALRKAMGKKLPEEMEKHKEAFIKGAVSNGIKKAGALELFNLMAKFAEYGFNKSHSAAYAYIAYQTAYLKAHYPVEFMAATLSADIDSTDKIVKSIKELKSMGIDILPPDINHCGVEFRAIGASIRFGLGAVKGVGAAAVESIIAERQRGGPFASFEDFRKRVDGTKVNKKVMEALIKAGAFDSATIGDSEPGVSAIASGRAGNLKTLNSSGGATPSLSLFEQPEEKAGEEAGDEAEFLRNEKEALGFYITGNPMTKYREALAAMNIRGTSGLEEAGDREDLELAGIVTAIKRIRTGKGDIMAYMSLEDDEGSVEVIVFPELLKNNPELVKKDTPVLVKGAVDRTDKGIKLVAKELSGLESWIKDAGSGPKTNGNGKKVEISINIGNGPDMAEETLLGLKSLLALSPGAAPLYLKIRIEGRGEALILTAEGVRPDLSLIKRVEGFLGKGSVRVR
ncbi:MAG: DNA polymerase III subunit alpha [Thermodesulfovibrionales bacterium]|nr:DNA polymerase III subunit alpha [Thermodesulfovibrionales bacterium]